MKKQFHTASSRRDTPSKRKTKTADATQPNRIVFIEAFFLLVALILVSRLVYIQLLQRGKYQNAAKSQHYSAIPLEAQRGLIYDRNHNMLALNDASISVGVDLRQVKDRRGLAHKLARILGESAATLFERMRTDRPFVWLKRRVDAELAKKIEASHLPGIRIEKDMRRRYPHKEIGAHVIGYTDVDNRGISGVELASDSLLAGQNGRKFLQKDAIGNSFPNLAMPDVPPVHGQHIFLTLDYVIQTIATEELRSAMDFFDASQGTVVVTNPQTGEILAMVNEPGFDPNNPGAHSVGTRRNRAVADQFEPGSTFKLITFAAVLQENVRRPEDVIFCENGAWKFVDKVITDHGERYGNLSVAEVLAKSSNIGTTKLARLARKEKIYHYARDFGFGMPARAGIEGEANGTLKMPGEWSGYTIAAMAMGYEVSVTALQMAMAYGVVANGGLLLQPKILMARSDAHGRVERFDEPKIVRRVLTKEVAAELSHMLEGAVKNGTGKNAALEGVRVAGKTGTAHRALQNARGYSRSNYISSFVGFFPAEQPRYLIYVMLENPRNDHWGSSVAAPTFRQIAQRILGAEPSPAERPGMPHENFTENYSETIMDTRKIVLPDLTSRHRNVGEEILKSLALKPIWDGEGDFILNQMPPPGSTVLRNSPVTLQLFEVGQMARQARMPNLVGLSLRQALRQLSVANVEARVVGSGSVVQQYPPPGTPISSGVRCELRCRSEVVVAQEAVLQ